MSFLDFKPKNIPADLISGAITGIIAIPDAIASAFLAGVTPTYAFNALMTGTPIGSLFSGSHYMNIGLTSAMMLAVADATIGISSEDLLTPLFTLVVLVGLFQLILGLLKLGRFTKFISNSVMVGFITGIAVVVILGQLGGLTGYYSEFSGTFFSTIDTLSHPGEWDIPTTVTSVVTIALILILSRFRRLKNFSIVIAMILGTALVFIQGWSSVELVGDTAEISGSFPLPVLPNLSMIPRLILPAVAIGLIGLIQASGVSQSVPNPDGEYPDASKDFSAQGIANLVAGTFQGLPLGGSLGGTAIILGTGGRSRWANIFVGLFVLVFVLLFGNLVELVAMPTVAAILFVVGFGIINPAAIADVWDVSRSKRITMVVTFLLAVTLPVQQAILIGVFISFIDHIFSSGQAVQLAELEPTESGELRVKQAPAELPDNSVTLLHSLSSTHFAAARTLQEMLPMAKSAQNAVVIVRLRGSESIGSTFILVLERYAAELRANGGRLMLSGVHEKVMEQILRTETTESVPEDAIFMATDILGKSTKAAVSAAHAWLDAKEPNQETEREVATSQEEDGA